MSGREELHKLVDGIADAEVDAAVDLSLLSAPPDDEPETEGDRQAVDSR
jgi:hypothetical protein